MLTIVLIILLVLVLSGYGYGFQTGTIDPRSVAGIVLVIVFIVVLVSLLTPLWHGPIVPAPVLR